MLKKCWATALSLVMLLSLMVIMPTTTNAANNETFTVIAGSDFQSSLGAIGAAVTTRAIADNIKNNGVTSSEGFLFCGDYSYAAIGDQDATQEGVDALREAVSGVATKNMVFVQGNHDSAIETAGMSSSGNNDHPDGKYGVFVINEDDYMWYNSDENRIKHTAQNLIEYLNAKIAQGYNKPIFVVSHLPLNYSMRTKNDGDGMHANYIFDVLNSAGAKGLNIIFMFGHDHSNGWDDYLGGSCVYLEKGDEILIAQNSRTVFKTEKLNFTYMNPGYVGYYHGVNAGSDTTLTMSVFEIDNSRVEISRYSANEVHNLKSAGVTNSFKDETGYSPNETIYNSPRTIELTDVTDQTLIDDLIDEPIKDGGRYRRVTSTSQLRDGGKYLLIYNSTKDYIMLPSVVEKSNGSSSRKGFELEKISDGILHDNFEEKVWEFKYNDGNWLVGKDKKYISFTNDPSLSIVASLEDDGTPLTIGGSEGNFTFSSSDYCLNYNNRGLINGYINYPAAFYIYEYIGGVKYQRITSTSQLKGGGKYLLVYNSTQDYIMLPSVVEKSNGSSSRKGFDLEETGLFGDDTIYGYFENKVWEFRYSDGKWLVGKNNKYVSFANDPTLSIVASLEYGGMPLTIGGSADNFTFSSSDYCLNYNNRGLINGYSSYPASFYIYEYTGTRGDVDFNGNFDIRDLVRFKKYLASHKNTDIDLIAAELDGIDGIDCLDLIALRKMLLN